MTKKTSEEPAPAENKPTAAVMPLLPLRDVTVFPSMIIPLFVGRDKSIRALERAMEEKRTIVLVSQKDARTETPTPADVYSVGTASEIMQMLKLADGTIKVIIEGVQRVKIKRFLQTMPFFEVEVERIPTASEDTPKLEALTRSVLVLFEKYVKYNRMIPPEAYNNAASVPDPGKLADLIASHLSLKTSEKQKLLEALKPVKRLEDLSVFLTKEIEILQIERNIQNRVRKQIEKSQKDYFLKEQLKAIHQELGEEDERQAEVNELLERIAEAELPDEPQERVMDQIKKLQRMPPGSAEATVVRNYIDWILALPWTKKTRDRLDFKIVRKVLDEDHYGLEKIKERILEYLAVRKLARKVKGAILCFVGPPGVGKTSLGKSIARAMNRKYVRISLGGVRDEAEVRGHRRTYIGALPGRILQTMKKAETRNPVFLMDEVDKMSTDFRGDPSAALLEVLDPEQNTEFSDHYLEVPYDLSDVMFITTANLLDPIPPALKDRMEVIRLPGYTEDEKLEIAIRHLVPKQRTEHGLARYGVDFTRDALMRIIREYTREAGVRNLERSISNIYRKIARQIVEKEKFSKKLNEKHIEKYLGAPKFPFTAADLEPESGVATGLAWTQAGGELLYVEASLMKGKGELKLTGQLGEVMKESAQAALSWIRAHADEYGVAPDFAAKNDIHLHVPEGAIPKDGPSAGLTMVAAMVSAVTGRKVKKTAAMTGEITLRGKVLPVGGIKEKTLAAHRFGIKTVIMPEENRKDREDIPKNVLSKLDIVYVDRVAEALELALLPPASARKKPAAKAGRGKPAP